MKATFENSFCLDNRCIHHFEDMCMGALSDNGSETEIEPLVTSQRIKDCPEFKAGTFIIYEVDLKEEDFDELR